mmetsp:Transcript_33644/g.24667  ORF Transcript_33644/g.24667 Transcript_33644/m.24667 type:complete len:165 (+) Transcript_33644:115-609(+)|eukprot:CAMPEP_0202972558 /NCGR_PEP_ID=MMETSP1396-20130829/37375_1 /ASSEMBLY_ACC=CAM_ASM_000872 /TAXON_ID= /ORGANISM="Pseudokeronopsis sp., Strain Brazil" /LENGTH=164 /DNA_ID=CAMNT_0049703089 /DNA_START=107 /DNA_END=601 /DNA_ORIENTATION=-
MSADALQSIKVKVDELLAKVPIVDEKVGKVAQAIKTEKAYVAIGFVVVLIAFAFLLGFGELLLDAVGFIYPAYASIQAIESESKGDDTQWLTYWLVFGFFKIFESFFDFFVSKVQFYFLIKLAFLVYLFLPQTQGAKVVYQAVIKPYVVPALGFGQATSGKKSD